MKRVGILHGGYPHALDETGQKTKSVHPSSLEYYSASDTEKTVPPSQRLRIARFSELSGGSGVESSYGSDE